MVPSLTSITPDFSYWENEASGNRWDVAIIGAGITGISTGISLLEKHPGVKVVVIDRAFTPLGASTRNAGFACFGSPSEILADIRLMGEKDALSLVQSRFTGLSKLKSRINHAHCRFESLGGYELYHDQEFEAIADQLGYLNQLLSGVTGVRETYKRVSPPSGILNFEHAIFNALEGQLHPARMMENLRDDFKAKGGVVHTGIDIARIEEEDEGVKLICAYSPVVQAKQVVVATNAFARQLLPMLDVHGGRNHVLVTSPIAGLQWKGCFHFDEGYYYFRNIGQRILLGGARNTDFEMENTTAFGQNPKILAALESFLYRHLADRSACTIEFQWSGIIGLGSDKMPIVRRISPRILAGVRLSGMGIALASLIGDELTDLCLQQDM